MSWGWERGDFVEVNVEFGFFFGFEGCGDRVFVFFVGFMLFF